MRNTRHYRAACGYVRSSACGPRLNAALLQQSRQINTFCSNGLYVLTSIVVEAQPANRQPHLDGLLDEACSSEHPYDLLIVTSESRLSRDPEMLQQIKTRLAAAGVTLAVLDTAQAPGVAPMAVETL